MAMEHKFPVIYSMKRTDAVLFLIGTVTVPAACVSQLAVSKSGEFVSVVHPPRETD
jgi:hypothetical protein